MKILKIFLGLIGGLVALVVVGIMVAVWVYRDIPAEDLEAKYANEESRFINIEGVRIHYRDEGPRDAPVVVLIHAHFASLIGWDDWVEALKDSYRVIRFDMTSHGLTGPDPSGDYSTLRTVDLTEKLVDALELETFSMGGTSLGGTVSMHYTGRHPDKVNSLILLSPGAIEGQKLTEERGQYIDQSWPLKYILPRALPKFMLTSAWGENTDKLTDEVIDRWHDMWLREDQREAELLRMAQYKAGDLEGMIGAITRPVLLMWGEANPQAPIEQAPQFIELLKNAEEVRFVTYPGVGHMAVQEAGELTGADARAYLDGELVGEVVASKIIEADIETDIETESAPES